MTKVVSNEIDPKVGNFDGEKNARRLDLQQRLDG